MKQRNRNKINQDMAERVLLAISTKSSQYTQKSEKGCKRSIQNGNKNFVIVFSNLLTELEYKNNYFFLFKKLANESRKINFKKS